MGLKPYVVTTYQGGVVTCASKGENAWDNMICTLTNKYLDYSIIDINVRRRLDVERIQEELNKEFEWDGPPFTLHALKRTLAPS
jgi:hypothetical protein